LLGGGCGRGDDLDKLVPVRGKVLLDGRPLTAGSVSFRPDASRGNTSQHQPYGILDGQGNYELKTANRRGAPPGWYKAVVISQEIAPEGKRAGPLGAKSRINPKYARPQTTDLTVEVVANPGPNAYDLRVRK
jgi:hypothetical protein